MLKPISHPSGVPLPRTIELILSVMVAKVWPGSITGCSTAASLASTSACFGWSDGSILNSLDLRIWIPQIPEIGGSRSRIQIG